MHNYWKTKKIWGEPLNLFPVMDTMWQYLQLLTAAVWPANVFSFWKYGTFCMSFTDTTVSNMLHKLRNITCMGYIEYMNNKKALWECKPASMQYNTSIRQCNAVLSQQYLLLRELNFVCIKVVLFFFLNILKKKSCVLGSTWSIGLKCKIKIRGQMWQC